MRMRLRAKCEIELEEHTSVLVFDGDGFATDFDGARELVDADLAPTIDAGALERRRIEAGVPRWGREIDERILPAEAGLDATHVDFGKGCYPGQEPVARLHYRGHPNRGLRVLELEAAGLDRSSVDGKAVGRVTSATTREDGSVVALACARFWGPQLALAHGEPAARWFVRRAQPKRPRAALCGYQLHAMTYRLRPRATRAAADTRTRVPRRPAQWSAPELREA